MHPGVSNGSSPDCVAIWTLTGPRPHPRLARCERRLAVRCRGRHRSQHVPVGVLPTFRGSVPFDICIICVCGLDTVAMQVSKSQYRVAHTWLEVSAVSPCVAVVGSLCWPSHPRVAMRYNTGRLLVTSQATLGTREAVEAVRSTCKYAGVLEGGVASVPLASDSLTRISAVDVPIPAL